LKNKKDLELFVGGLTFNATDNDVQQYFQSKGVNVL